MKLGRVADYLKRPPRVYPLVEFDLYILERRNYCRACSWVNRPLRAERRGG